MAAVRLFVGGLAFTTSTDGLRAAFARFGPVQSAAVMTDRETGRSRGFGFVEMASEEEAEKAISGLNGSSLDGRMIRVDRATPRGAGGPRPAGAGYGPRPGGGGGGFAPRPGGGGPPRSGGGGGWTPPMPEGRSGAPRRGSGGGNRRPGEPSGGEQRRPGNKKPGGKPTAPGEEKRGGRGRLGSDGDYRWGR